MGTAATWTGVGGVRIRWKGVGKLAAGAAAGLVALQALPGLLQAPQPPPLGSDVGLPQLERREPKPEVRPTEPRSARGSEPPPSAAAKRRDAPLPAPAGTKRISTSRSRPEKPRNGRDAPLGRSATRKSTSASEGSAIPPPVPVPEPAAAPVAPLPPAPPGDGSVEFMPH